MMFQCSVESGRGASIGQPIPALKVFHVVVLMGINLRLAFVSLWPGTMIMFLVVVLVLLWLLGMVTSYTLGGALHILLVVAIVFLLIRLIRGQPV